MVREYSDIEELKEYISENIYDIGEGDNVDLEIVEISDTTTDDGVTRIRYALYIQSKNHSEEDTTKVIITLFEYSPFKYEIEL